MRLILVGAVLAAALILPGCSGSGVDLAGGWHDLMKNGVHFSYSWATVVKPEIHVPPAEKIGGPPS